MKVNQIVNEDIPVADVAAMAAVAGLAAPVMMAMIKGAYKTGKGLFKIRKIAKQAGVKLGDRLMGEELVDFDKEDPMKSTVGIQGYGTMNIDSLMNNIISQAEGLIAQMKKGTQGFRNTDYALNSNKVLPAKVAALVKALDDLQAIRAKGGARSRNIQREVTEDGKIVPGVNTTVDVKPGQTEKEAKKYFGGNGKPKPLGVKGATPNQAFNLGLTEAKSQGVAQSAALRVLDNIAARTDGVAHPIKFYDGSIVKVKPETARKFINFYDDSENDKKHWILNYLKTKKGFLELMSPRFVESTLEETWNSIAERELTGGEKRSKEAHFKKLKKHKADFFDRYGKERGTSIMHAIATNRAKGV